MKVFRYCAHMPRIAFFDVDNTITRGSTLYFLGRGMYNRGFFTKRDIGAWVLANIRYLFMVRSSLTMRKTLALMLHFLNP